MRIGNRAIKAGAALLIVASLAVIGCGDDQNQSKAGSGSADSMFVNGMIPHHEAAVEMAKDAQNRAARPEIKQLADAIIESQTAEIAQMRSLQKELPKSSAMAMSTDDMQMMESDVERVRAADDFDKAFLLAMVPHHQMAVSMSEGVLRNGENQEIASLARKIISAQEKEIAEMQTWLKDWYDTSAPSSDSGMMDGHSMDHGGM